MSEGQDGRGRGRAVSRNSEHLLEKYFLISVDVKSIRLLLKSLAKKFSKCRLIFGLSFQRKIAQVLTSSNFFCKMIKGVAS